MQAQIDAGIVDHIVKRVMVNLFISLRQPLS